MKAKIKYKRRERRQKRIRAKIFGTKDRPRLSVFRSLKHIYAQIIDDEAKRTLVAASDQELRLKTKKQKSQKETERETKMKYAYEVGKLIAKKALEKNIKKVVFDRRGFKYHGRVKALAEGAREGGLVF